MAHRSPFCDGPSFVTVYGRGVGTCPTSVRRFGKLLFFLLLLLTAYGLIPVGSVTLQDWAMQYSTVQYNTVQYNNTLNNIQHSRQLSIHKITKKVNITYYTLLRLRN